MSRNLLGTIALTAVAASSLAAAVDHYHAVFTEASGATVSASVPVDGTQVPVTLDPGTWTATIGPMDAAGNALSQAVSATFGGVAGPFVVADKVVIMVNIPSALDMAYAD